MKREMTNFLRDRQKRSRCELCKSWLDIPSSGSEAIESNVGHPNDPPCRSHIASGQPSSFEVTNVDAARLAPGVAPWPPVVSPLWPEILRQLVSVILKGG